MKQICAWCGKPLNGSRARAKGKVSYGICVPCACGLITDNPEVVRQFIDQHDGHRPLLDQEGEGSTGKRRIYALR